MMKTLKQKAPVMHIQMSMLKTHSRTRMKIIRIRNNNHHRQNNGNNANNNNIKLKLLKTNAAVCFNKMCRTKHLTPKYIASRLVATKHKAEDYSSK